MNANREQKRKELLARFSEQPKPLVVPSPVAAPYMYAQMCECNDNHSAAALTEHGCALVKVFKVGDALSLSLCHREGDIKYTRLPAVSKTINSTATRRASPVVPPPEPEPELAIEDDALRDQIVVKIRDPTGKVRKIKILMVCG